jgi:hypothetical protein
MAEIRSDRFDDESGSSDYFMQEASSAVRLPATLLILTGVLGAIIAMVGMFQLNSLPAKFDEMIAQTEKDNTKTQQEKDQVIDVLTAMKGWFEEPAAIAIYIANLVCSLLVAVGGIRMMQLSGPAIPAIASIIAMIPCTIGCCCLLGLPAGIISLVVLNRPAVRAAMSARKAGFERHSDPEVGPGMRDE